MGKGGKKFINNWVEYDSEAEIWFSYWLEELLGKGYIKSWERNLVCINITQPVKNEYLEGKKTKSQTILREFQYTPDFKVEWDEKSRGIFFEELNTGAKITTPFIAKDLASVVEIKPVFDRNNMTRLFRQVQKFLFKDRQLYVNQIIVDDLFAKTFTPAKYLKTKTGKDRKVKWKVIKLDEYGKNI